MAYMKTQTATIEKKPLQFTHLHVHTQYSLLDGAAKPEALLKRAIALGMEAIAITDHGNMYGAVDLYQTAEKLNKEAVKNGKKPIKIIFGCECYLASGNRAEKDDKQARYHIILLAENDIGYHNLSKLVSLGFIEGFYRKPRIDKELLRKHHEGIICLSACVQGEIPRLIIEDKILEAEIALQEYIDIFGKDNFFLEIQNHDLPEERKANAQLRLLAKKYGIGLVATNDVHYVEQKDALVQDVLLCIQTGKTMPDPGRLRFNNDWYYLKNAQEMQALFPDIPEAIENTNKIAKRCNVGMEFGHLLLPEFPIPEKYNNDADAYIRSLCEENIVPRYSKILGHLRPETQKAKYKVVRDRMEYELGVIKKMGYAAYFLIVWDFINYCRNHKDEAGNPDPIPVGPGRGSAAGSIVAYLLHITNIEPLSFGLLFERFLNPDRVSMPDIDTDFCYRRRGEVMDYVIRKYGADHVSLIITFGTLAARAAVRDVARALGVPLPKADKIAKAIPKEVGITLEKALENKDLKTMYDTDPETKKVIDIAKSVEGLPRNSGTHAAGVVIAPKPLVELVPLQLDEAKDENTVIGQDRMITTQFDKTQVEDLGLLKMDFLGLRTLTVISDTLKFIKETTGETIDIDAIPLKDKPTSDMLCAGQTQGVFQLESAGITQLTERLAPQSMRDLVPLVALYRPGPLDAGMAEKFIEGRNVGHATESIHPLLDGILKETYGVVLYQEQVMQTASILADFTMAEADMLRRAMGKKKAKDLAAMKDRFVSGAKELNKIPEKKSTEIFDILLKFAGYGFNKSHSVAYAMIAWQTAYLKAHWPAEFFAAFLTSVMHDTDKVSHYISVCKDMGIKVLPPDVNASMEGFSVENDAIRFGLIGIKNVGRAAVEEIINARKNGGRFPGIGDFCYRVNYKATNKRMTEALIRCGAMDSFGAYRSQLLAVYETAFDAGANRQKENENGFIDLFCGNEFAEAHDITLPGIQELPQQQKLSDEKSLTGFYITGHPLDIYKETIKKLTPISELITEPYAVPDGNFTDIGGLVSKMEIRVTKKGETMAILQIEDFTGHMEAVVFPQAYEKYSNILTENAALEIEGRFSAEDRGNKIIAQNICLLTTNGKPKFKKEQKQAWKKDYKKYNKDNKK